jgi:tripartite ATP-independent transporter DctM subunit
VALLFGSFFLLLVIGYPIAMVMIGSSMLWFLNDPRLPEINVLHRVISGVDSFPLLAVPFFILAGNLMNFAGITNRIFGFALALLGWLRGGLGYVCVLASMIFAGMTGAAVAEAGGLGVIQLKAMRDAGYDDDFAVGLIGSASTIGPIIPPSLAFVVYGVLANASIGEMFAAGFVPGVLMGLLLMVMVFVYAWRRNYPRDKAFSIARVLRTFSDAFLSLMTPVIIVGGMLSGIFTPTEAAIAAVFYAMVLGLFVYRTLTWRTLTAITLETIETTAIVMLIVGGASIFAWVLTHVRATEAFASAILAVTSDKWLILLLINVILLVVGCFMESIAAITILVPVFLPLVVKVGVDPVHFGLIMTLNLMIGLLTPPVGMVLYVLARVAHMPFERCARASMPFLIPLAVALLLVTYVPAISMWLPTLLYR